MVSLQTSTVPAQSTNGPVLDSITLLRAQASTSLTIQPQLNFDRFHLFPKLPLELRLAIGKLTIAKPRRVAFGPRTLRTSSDLAPAILAVNHESRMLALQSYINIHERTDKWHRQTSQLTDYVRYINTENDALVVEIDYILTQARYLLWWTKHSRKAVESIKKLVFNEHIVDYYNLREFFLDG
jgi:hypothetical protein